MEPYELWEAYPKLYHMAESGSWPSIQAHGLLSTSALLDLYMISGAERRALESERRPESVTISHHEFGTAVIRDQKPINEKSLRKCLTDMSPREWSELLNHKVFFWLTEERLNRLLSARAYRAKSHAVLTVETRKLVERHERQITLSRINSGSVIYGVGQRGRETFKTIGDVNRIGSIAELAIDYAVDDIADLVLVVEERRGSQPPAVLWQH
jgi:hypothetical protein